MGLESCSSSSEVTSARPVAPQPGLQAADRQITLKDHPQASASARVRPATRSPSNAQPTRPNAPPHYQCKCVRDGLVGVHGFALRAEFAVTVVAEHDGEVPDRLAAQLGEEADSVGRALLHRRQRVSLLGVGASRSLNGGAGERASSSLDRRGRFGIGVRDCPGDDVEHTGELGSLTTPVKVPDGSFGELAGEGRVTQARGDENCVRQLVLDRVVDPGTRCKALTEQRACTRRVTIRERAGERAKTERGQVGHAFFAREGHGLGGEGDRGVRVARHHVRCCCTGESSNRPARSTRDTPDLGVAFVVDRSIVPVADCERERSPSHRDDEVDFVLCMRSEALLGGEGLVAQLRAAPEVPSDRSAPRCAAEAERVVGVLGSAR